MMVLFGCIEIGRAYYTGAMLSEGTRRAARLAAVCPINDPAIANAVNFAGLSGFTSANVSVQYLDASGTSLGATPAVVGVYYARVSVTGYTMSLSIPIIEPTVTFPPYAVTIPTESLGISVSTTGSPPTSTVVTTAC
jgi:Flp pilus assembly protein TadG